MVLHVKNERIQKKRITYFLPTAILGIVSNNKRLAEYSEAFQNDENAFIVCEQKRVEGFQYLYKVTTIIAAVSFVLAIGFFLFTNNYILRAIGLALILFGLTGLFIDYFSKERADSYYKTT